MDMRWTSGSSVGSISWMVRRIAWPASTGDDRADASPLPRAPRPPIRPRRAGRRAEAHRPLLRRRAARAGHLHDPAGADRPADGGAGPGGRRAALRRAGVAQAAFFVNPGNLQQPWGAGREAQIAAYVRAGHVIGNHSW